MFPFANPRSTAAAVAAVLRPQDVFATSLYTGNRTQRTITTGVDMTNGGLVWQKGRSNSPSHSLCDTARGINCFFGSDLTEAEINQPDDAVSQFLATGYVIGTGENYARINNTGQTFAAWSFRRAPKFFDIVTYVGDGTSGRQIPHGLGVAPGMVVVKRRDAAGDWPVWHRSLAGELYLNATAAQQASFFATKSVAATTFTVDAGVSGANTSGAAYVAYLFAHDPDTMNGIIQCGSVTTDGSGNATVNLGWQPQWAIVKISSAAGDWNIYDTTRGWGAGSDAFLKANLANTEGSFDLGAPTSTGFTLTNYGASTTAIYLAIRAPIT